ncbi:MAG: serine/threonine protein kinase [Planctomycetales bacterium]|nr:serine/threonine protein kinase [Planctomycetales bacterium]
MLTQANRDLPEAALRQLGNNFVKRGADQNQGSGELNREESMQNFEPNADEREFGATVADHNADIRKRPMKFAYASGSQPLAGFTIKRGVGFGGFGDVYYATSDAGKEVALKRIQRNLDVELRGVRQCLNLKHPNLVSLYDIRYDDEGQAWVVMEYVSGESLQDVIERNPNGMPVDQVVSWFRGLAEGVAYLHDNGIVHRDLKPGNIFVDSSLVKIGDYGLAKFISCSRRSGQTESVGTFHYMAPEIGLGRYGKEIDIYAMGIMLFEMLTGRVPYDGESSQEIIMKHLTAEPDVSMLAEPYRSVIAKSLNKDPEKRYRSVLDMANGLGLASGANPGPQQVFVNQNLNTADKNSAVTAQVVAPAVASIPEEPIAKAVRELLTKANAKWNSPEINFPAKICFVICFVLIMMSVGGPLLGFAFVAAGVYAVYYVVWYLLNAIGVDAPTRTVDVPVNAEVVTPVAPKPDERLAPAVKRARRPKPINKQQIAFEVRQSLGQQSLLRKARDLTGSMLMAAAVVSVVCVLTMLIGIQNLDTAIYSWGPNYAWMTLSSVVAAWSILLLSKFWEKTSGDQALRRFLMLTVGLGVGAFSFFLARVLMFSPGFVLTGIEGPLQLTETNRLLYNLDGTPDLLAYMAYFGTLFGGLRMWLHADPLRASRLRFFSTLIVIGAGILLHTVLPIPKGFLIAATTAIAVQLSSPWIDNDERYLVKKKLEQRQLEMTS